MDSGSETSKAGVALAHDTRLKVFGIFRHRTAMKLELIRISHVASGPTTIRGEYNN